MNSIWKYTTLPLVLAAGLMWGASGTSAQELGTASSWTGNPAVGAELFNSCTPCHGLQGKSVAGLPEKELMQKMEAYRQGTYNDAQTVKMQKILQQMSQQQLFDLAAYMTKM